MLQPFIILLLATTIVQLAGESHYIITSFVTSFSEVMKDVQEPRELQHASRRTRASSTAIESPTKNSPLLDITSEINRARRCNAGDDHRSNKKLKTTHPGTDVIASPEIVDDGRSMTLSQLAEPRMPTVPGTFAGSTAQSFVQARRELNRTSIFNPQLSLGSNDSGILMSSSIATTVPLGASRSSEWSVDTQHQNLLSTTPSVITVRPSGHGVTNNEAKPLEGKRIH